MPNRNPPDQCGSRVERYQVAQIPRVPAASTTTNRNLTEYQLCPPALASLHTCNPTRLERNRSVNLGILTAASRNPRHPPPLRRASPGRARRRSALAAAANGQRPPPPCRAPTAPLHLAAAIPRTPFTSYLPAFASSPSPPLHPAALALLFPTSPHLPPPRSRREPPT